MKRRILIVEDDVFVGLDLQEQLMEEGFDAVGPYVSVADAEDEFAANGCCAAVLDVNLGKETSEMFAHTLKTNGVPFVILSGYSRDQHPLSLRGEASITKPVNVTDLIRLLNLVIEVRQG